MKAVSDQLLLHIHLLQNLPSLKESSLGGGTSLALRYNHRESVDIDLFFDDIIGRAGYAEIERELQDTFGDNVYGVQYPCNENDQFIFMRFFIRSKGSVDIKVEILQNFKRLYPYEVFSGVRMLTELDIGLLKLMAGANRAEQKDIFDLDFITENIPLEKLMSMLKEKQDQFHKKEHRTIFDLEGEQSPVDYPLLLLKFEENRAADKRLPGHSTGLIRTMADGKNWLVVRSSWRRKLRKYYDQIGVEFPSAGSQP